MNDVLAPGQLSEMGKQEYQDKQYAAAAGTFAAAGAAYAAAGEPLAAAEMDNNRSVALLQAGDAPGALQAVEGTPEIFANAGDVRCQAMAVGNRAAALKELNQIDAAIADYEQAVELFTQIGERELRGVVLQTLSTLHLRAGRKYEAIASLNAGFESEEKPSLLKRIRKKLIDIPFRYFFRL